MIAAPLEAEIESELKVLERELDRVLHERKRERILEEMSSGVWIYGAGHYGRRIASLMLAHAIPLRGFIDRRAASLGELQGAPVVAPENLTGEIAQEGVFVLGVSSVADVSDALSFSKSLPFRHRILTAELPDVFGDEANNYWLCPRQFLRENFGNLRRTVARFHDPVSQRILLQLIRYRIGGDASVLPHYDVANQYIPPDLPPFEGPVSLVDGGAFDGDCFRRFSEQGTALRHWFAFEPDDRNFRALSQTAARATCAATLFPCGLADRRRRVSFSNEGSGASKIVEGHSETTIECVALDDVLFGQQIDLIKLDLEGGEMAALSGMTRICAQSRPRLAISAYHKPDDIWIIPERLEEILEGSHLHVRLHAANGFDTVDYALP